MRGFQTLVCAQVVCQGHGFLQNLRKGFYDSGNPAGQTCIPRVPRLVRAWNELMLVLSMA